LLPPAVLRGHKKDVNTDGVGLSSNVILKNTTELSVLNCSLQFFFFAFEFVSMVMQARMERSSWGIHS